MSTLRHVVVWLDHHDARILGVEAGYLAPSTIRLPQRHVRRHAKGAAAEHHHPDELQHFFRDVAQALQESTQVLIVGPSTAKLQFLKYVQKEAHELEAKIIGVETVDHPTDGQLVAYAKHYFGIPDRFQTAL